MISTLKNKYKNSILLVNSKSFEMDASDNMILVEIVAGKDFPRQKFESFFETLIMAKKSASKGRYIGESHDDIGAGTYLGFKVDRFKAVLPSYKLEAALGELSKYKSESVDSVRLCYAWQSHPFKHIVEQVSAEPMPFAAFVHQRLKQGEVSHTAQIKLEDILLDIIGAPEELSVRAMIQHVDSKQHSKLQQALCKMIKSATNCGAFSIIEDVSPSGLIFKANALKNIEPSVAEEYFI